MDLRSHGIDSLERLTITLYSLGLHITLEPIPWSIYISLTTEQKIAIVSEREL